MKMQILILKFVDSQYKKDGQLKLQILIIL